MIYIFKDREGKEFRSTDYQNAFLGFLFSKTKFFTGKNSYRTNVLVPKTLRELHNNLAYIESINSKTELKKYVFDGVSSIGNKVFVKFFDALEDINITQLNKYLVESLISDNFLYNLIEDDEYVKNVTISFRNIVKPQTKYYNISFSDVYTVITGLESQISLINSDALKFISHLKQYYSLRLNILSLNTSNVDSEEKLISILGTTVTNEIVDDIFPKQKKGNKRRDRIEINNFRSLQQKYKREEISTEEFYWLGFFISHIGGKYNDFRISEEKFFSRSIFKDGPEYDNAIFNWTSFIYKSLVPNMVYNQFFGENSNENSNLKLRNDMISWKDKIDNYSILFNVEFMEVLLKSLKESTSDVKDTLGDYENTMYTFFFEKLPLTFERIGKEYPYVDVNATILLENPLIRYWSDNRERIKVILDFIFKTDDDVELLSKIKFSLDSLDELSKEEIKSKAENNLHYYSDRYFEIESSYTSQGAKLAMNNLIKDFHEYKQVSQDLQNMRNSMEVNTQEGLQNIKRYLELIING